MNVRGSENAVEKRVTHNSLKGHIHILGIQKNMQLQNDQREK
jgi:hypothetical protein